MMPSLAMTSSSAGKRGSGVMVKRPSLFVRTARDCPTTETCAPATGFPAEATRRESRAKGELVVKRVAKRKRAATALRVMEASARHCRGDDGRAHFLGVSGDDALLDRLADVFRDPVDV